MLSHIQDHIRQLTVALLGAAIMIAGLAVAPAHAVGNDAIVSPQANCISMTAHSYENKVKPASACSDVNVNGVTDIPASSVWVWGEYRNSSGTFVASSQGGKEYKRGHSYSQWIAIKGLKSGSLFRMRGTHRVTFALRV